MGAQAMTPKGETMSEDEKEHAFPTLDDDRYYHGMSLRDYFAAKAMQSLIIEGHTLSPEVPLSVRAYEIADAMIEARTK
jgi:hypothetical protein